MAHTPGPWHTVPALAGNLIQGADGSRVVRGQGGIKAWGDARLIAAAPELLEALGMVVFEGLTASDQLIPSDRLHAALVAARDVIVKAEGR